LTFWHLSQLWRQGLYPSLEEDGVKCWWPDYDSMLHFGVFCKLIAS
jgi:hypothetical protein